ncbi:ATP-binding protein [Pseudonocardia sp. Cha107L01]|uniref:ATP-binding protein n=1 Tax=Pseudonocardia sp. Cha107L01 TaxID=3457576 RepID=UPI00403E4C09
MSSLTVPIPPDHGPACRAGNTDLATVPLGLAACEQGRRVRYVITAQLVNELVEAANERVLSRLVARYGRLDLLCLDLCRRGDYAEWASLPDR